MKTLLIALTALVLVFPFAVNAEAPVATSTEENRSSSLTATYFFEAIGIHISYDLAKLAWSHEEIRSAVLKIWRETMVLE